MRHHFAKRALSVVMIPAAACAFSAHAATEFDFSLSGGMVNGDRSDDIPYAYDSDTQQTITGDLGDGLSFGAGVGVTVDDTWRIALDYQQNRMDSTAVYDSDLAATNDCNIQPVQGFVDDCFDNANYDVETKFWTVDLVAGYKMTLGSAEVTPYVGLRYLDYEQDISTDYLYPGGFENFATNQHDYSGFGPKIGVDLFTGIGSTQFFVEGGLAVARIMTGDRKQDVYELRTIGGSFLLDNAESEERDIDPTTIEASVKLGYDFRNGTRVGLGYRYHRISDLLDTRTTNEDPAADEFSGKAEADIEAGSVFLELTQTF